MTDKKPVPDYHSIIPKSLLAEADALIDYVTYFPYQFPTECPYCGYTSFRQLSNRNVVGEPRFQCYHCNREFSQLSGTYFARLSRMELWPDFVKFRLVGMSTNKIHKRLNISEHACLVRDRRLHKMMDEFFPKLYQWWRPRHDYVDHTFTKEIVKEQQILIDWLTERMEQQTATCPKCGQFIRQRANLRIGEKLYSKSRPYFECGRCSYKFNIFKETPFNKLSHMDLWIPFIKELCLGKNHEEIFKILAKDQKISLFIAKNWRNKFMEQMQIMGLTKLLSWIKWQRIRNKAAVSSRVKRQAEKRKKAMKKELNNK